MVGFALALESDAAKCRRARLKHLLKVKGQVNSQVKVKGEVDLPPLCPGRHPR